MGMKGEEGRKEGDGGEGGRRMKDGTGGGGGVEGGTKRFQHCNEMVGKRGNGDDGQGTTPMHNRRLVVGYNA